MVWLFFNQKKKTLEKSLGHSEVQSFKILQVLLRKMKPNISENAVFNF
jgi:hypothetical protein